MGEEASVNNSEDCFRVAGHPPGSAGTRSEDVNDAAQHEEESSRASDQSLLLLSKLFHSNLVPMSRGTIRGQLLEVNDAYAKMLGYSVEELIAAGWAPQTAPEFSHLDRAAIAAIQQGKPVPVYEKQYVRKNGGRVSVLMGVTASDASGSNVLCFCIDITDRKRAQESLSASQNQLRILLDTIPQIVCLADANLKVEYFNRQFYDFTGTTAAEDLNKLGESVVHPDDLQMLQSRREQLQIGDGVEAEVRIRTSKGNYAWILLRVSTVRDEHGQMIHWIGTCIDIDEKKRSERELRESEERFRTLADAIPQIVWTATPDGTVDFFNHRWLEYTSLSVEQSLSGAWKLLIHPDDLEGYLGRFEQAQKTGQSYQHEFRLKRAVGLRNVRPSGYRLHLCKASALKNSRGEVIKWFVTWTEIEDQMRKNMDGRMNGSDRAT